MERVVILGPGGAGKTELATTIAQRTGLPVVHLDPIFWRRGWTPAPRERALADFAEAVARDRWILDGNFLDEADGIDGRFARADTVIFVDLPRGTCMWRVLKRLALYRRRSRPDLPEGCAEGFDLSLLRWIWRYPRTDRPRVVEILAGLDRDIDVCHLRSRSEVRRYVGTL